MRGGQSLRAWSAGVLLPAALLSACGTGSETGPGGVTEGEAAALDEIAEELDKQQIPEGAIPPVDLPAPQQASEAQDNTAEDSE